jgi:hypothetical protein
MKIVIRPHPRMRPQMSVRRLMGRWSSPGLRLSLGVRTAGLAFIDCSVKPPVSDWTRSVTVPYLAPYDRNLKEVE